MLGKVQVLHLMERLGKACRTACLRKRFVKALHQNSKNESLPNIGCLSWFMLNIKCKSRAENVMKSCESRAKNVIMLA